MQVGGSVRRDPESTIERERDATERLGLVLSTTSRGRPILALR